MIPNDPLRLYLYVQCQVLPANPESVSLLNGLVEKTSGQPQPDVIPHTDPGGISFAKMLVEASDEDEAYDSGFTLLEIEGHKRQEGAVMNDWVIDLTALGLQRVPH